ncbi:MAG: type secretion system family protein [Thermomicrobiales bacterium]|nr:type secretion system family protein [Thermomicrobiales bacterium]
MNLWQLAIDDPVMLAPIAIFFIVFGLSIAVTEGQSLVSARLARHRMAGSRVALVLSLPRLSSGPPPPRSEPAARGGRAAPGLSSEPPRSEPAKRGRLAALFDREKSADQTRALLTYAGSPMSLKAYTRMRRLFSYVLTPLLVVLTLNGLGLKPLGIAAAAIFAVALPRLPAIYLKRLAKKRAQQMDAVIADVMDLLVVCVEGGQTLTAALMQLSQRMDNIAADEFRHLLADINSGVSRRDAFAALAERCQSEALGIACTLIVHADKIGMSLTHTLRTLSDMMRTRRRRAAETRARQAPIKMMPVLVGFTLPTMLALLLGPVALEAMEHFR